MADIGEPKRKIRIEPEPRKVPAPRREPQRRAPEPERKEPARQPADRAHEGPRLS